MWVVELDNTSGTEGLLRPYEGLLGGYQDPADVASHGYTVAWVSRWAVSL